jgi:hypothetical protein
MFWSVVLVHQSHPQGPNPNSTLFYRIREDKDQGYDSFHTRPGACLVLYIQASPNMSYASLTFTPCSMVVSHFCTPLHMTLYDPVIFCGTLNSPTWIISYLECSRTDRARPACRSGMSHTMTMRRLALPFVPVLQPSHGNSHHSRYYNFL